MTDRWTRRAFIGAAAAAAGGAAWWSGTRGEGSHGEPDPAVVAGIPGEIVGQSVARGHLLRDPAWQAPPPTDLPRVRTVIVGSGIAGLSAAWAFDGAAWDDYLVLELEPRYGGTSAWQDYAASAAPWGAHYLPLPTPESRAVRRLLKELGVITGFKWDGTPVYDDIYLCQAPQERLYINSMWQDGLWPAIGATKEDNAQLDAFHADMERWRIRTGSDGKSGFTIPLAYASQDPVFLDLDRISMAEYLARNGYTSRRLRWYVEYATRDDYGCTLDHTSAWVGIHYFISRGEKRRTAAYRDTDDLLTWPEGNGWLARRLRDRIKADRIRSQALVYAVDVEADGVTVSWLEGSEARRVRCDSVVLAVPRFVAVRICPRYAALSGQAAAAFSYAPWVVSNLVVSRLPVNNGPHGYPLCWDNVIYDSDSLGYVVATHQSLRTADGPSVLTHYQPLTQKDPRAIREFALRQPWTAWRDNALRDLYVPHPGIERTVERLDVMVWGHAMIRPTPNFIWGPARQAAAASPPRVAVAHTDLSGIAIFEEAQYHGVAAAQSLMRAAGHAFEDLL